MKQVKPIQLVHLYPKEMNIYGDTGNRIVLEKRMQWRDLPYKVHFVGVGDSIPEDADIILGGGGQDASQGAVEEDFLKKQSSIAQLSENGAVMLMVCGMYQLLGERFVTTDGVEIKGLGVLPVETIAKDGRIIGNIVAEADDIGTLVGYENHSGRTYLKAGANPLARVVSGVGNNDDSGDEGCRYLNIFGTYMHGPVLSKNPVFADVLLSLALNKNGYDAALAPLDDSLEISAQEIAKGRPR